MDSLRPLEAEPVALAVEQLGYFRWGRVANRILITTDAGDWAFLTDEELQSLLAGGVRQGHPRFEELQSKGFLRDGLDLDAFARRLGRRLRHLTRGPHLYVVSVRGERGALGETTGDRIIDVAFQTSAPSVTFEFVSAASDPVGDLDAIRRFVDVARQRNRRVAGKALAFRIVTDLSAMSSEAADWVIEHDIGIRTRLDGPAALHDANRASIPGAAHATVAHWIDELMSRRGAAGRTADGTQLVAQPIVTRQTLNSWRDVVDEYRARGLRSIRLQPLSSFGLAPAVWQAVGYRIEEYLAMYRQALSYLIELNRQGTALAEVTAALFASKILASDDVGIVDIQSPSGDGTGQLVFDETGQLYPNEEAALLARMGEPMFALGSVSDLALSHVVRHPTVRALAAASTLDSQPMCADCWNKPYCGVSPVRNFIDGGDLFGQRPRSALCKEHMAVAGCVFELLADSGKLDQRAILESWTSPNIGFGGGRWSMRPA